MANTKLMSDTPTAGADDAIFVEKIAVGLQSQDIIRITSAYLDPGITATALQQQLEQYNDDIGAFLEAISVIPSGTGDVFNLLQLGKSKKDALAICAMNNSIGSDTMKTVYEHLSSEKLLTALEALSVLIPVSPM